MKTVAVFGLFLLACDTGAPLDGAAATPLGTVCKRPHGFYRRTVVKVAGTCGDANGQVEVLDIDHPEPGTPSCIDTSTTNSSCMTKVERACTFPDGHTFITYSGAIGWTADGESGTGVLTFQIPTCLGSMHVTYARP